MRKVTVGYIPWRRMKINYSSRMQNVFKYKKEMLVIDPHDNAPPKKKWYKEGLVQERAWEESLWGHWNDDILLAFRSS